MRNLKRALSLTLASVMLLGMMVVGTSAAAGYSDVTDENNVEAIEVLQEIEVMVGDERGFGPERPVNRAEMAVVMGKLLNLDYDYYSTSCPFNDVYDWARGWVGACYANKIVSGRGEGVYDPGATVTAVEAASMLMRALGYFQYANDVVDGFELSTVRQGTKIGIFDGVGSSATAPMTRDQVAKMVLNALQSDVVEPDGNTINLTTPDGTVLTGKVNYVSVTRYEPYARAIKDTQASSVGSTNDGWIVELGERLYNGDLKLNPNTTDAFGRPSRTWEYKGNTIGTYMKKELIRAEYTEKVTGKDLYDLLGKDTIESERPGEKYDFYIYVDGEDRYSATDGVNGVSTVFNKTQMNKNNKAGVGGTGVGTLTQVFVDADKKDVTIAVINTYLARAKADYNEKRDEASFNVYAIKKGTVNSTDYFWKAKDKDNDQKETMIVSNEDFPVANVAENDPFLVTVAEGEIQSMVAPEVLSSVTLDSFKRDDNVVTEGTTYKYTTTAQYNVEVLDDYTGDSNYGVNLKDKHYNIYLDAYGNLIGIDLVENADNYVFITGVDSKSSNLAAKQYDANAIFLDGTMKTITFDNEKSTIGLGSNNGLLNTWCTYTVSGDIYTLKEVSKPATSATTVDGTSVGIGDSFVGLKNGTSKAIKVGQYYDKMNDDLNGNNNLYSETNEINVKRVSLRGAADASRSAFKYVYGNDETVYLNTEVKGIYTSGSNGDPRGVISKVTGVTTGIKNANLEVMNETQANDQAERKSGSRTVTPAYPVGGGEKVAYGAYVLYNDKGYVIAAVTVADDSAASENLVYIHSDAVKLERYDAANDEWTWQRDVVHNGEEITLTEVSDSISILKSVKQHNWYVVSYNADGEVISASHTKDELADKTTTQHCDNILLLETKVNTAGTNTVLYEKSGYEGLTAAAPNGCADNSGAPHTTTETTDNVNGNGRYHNNYGPKLEANTFYDITTATTGFYVNDDVKVVFIQKIKNVWTTEFKEGTTDLENVIDALIEDETDGTGKYYYEVSAVLNAGRADVVVIRDLHVHGDSGKDTVVTNDDLIVDLTSKTDVKVKYTGDTAPAVEDAVKAIRAKLEKDGFTVDKIEFVAQGERGSGPDPAQDQYEFTVSKSGVPMGKYIYKNISASMIQEITVKVNGTNVRIPKNTTAMSAVISAAGDIITDNGKWVKTKLNGTDDVKAIGATGLTIKNGDEFDFGWYKITVTETVSDGVSVTNKGSATLKAYLKDKDDTAYALVKKGTASVELDLKTDSNATTGKLTVTASNATVTGGATQDAISANGKTAVTVSVPVTNNDVAVGLTVTDYVANVTMNVTFNGTTKTITIPENTTAWGDVLAAVKAQTGTDWTDSATATSKAVRLDSDWKVGGAYGNAIPAGFKTSSKLTNNMSVTFGCVEMKRAATDTLTNAHSTVAWTIGDTTMGDMDANTSYYVLPGEKIKAVVTTDATGIKLAGTSATIAMTNATASGLETEITTAYTQSNASGTQAVNASKAVALGGTAADTFKSGVATFTLTVSTSVTNLQITVTGADA